MKAVVDTSIAVKWFTIEQDHERAKAIIGETLIAPDLILAEVSNVIWKKHRLAEIGSDQARLALSLVSSFVDLLPSPALAEAALEIAIELDHPVYDCFFLALSNTTGLPLITADRRLIARCAGTRFNRVLEALG